MNITTRPIEYKDGKTTCIGYLAWDESYANPKPCVLIAPDWRGRSEFVEDKAIQMAALGYVGFVVDVYGGGKQGSGPDENMKLMQPFLDNRKMLLIRLRAAMRAAGKLEQVDGDAIAMMGFCFGGLCALDLARSGADLKAAISFHGLFDGHNLPAKKIKASVLALHGWDDPMVPPEKITALGTELTKAGCDWQIHAYGRTSHAFTNPLADDKANGLQYSDTAERRAWMAATDLLNDKFSMHGVG